MGIFSKKSQQAGSPRGTASPWNDPPVDPSLADADWLAESNRRYQANLERFLGSPESIAAAAQNRLEHNDFGVALFLFQKAVDLLHTHYGYLDMRQRTPSAADSPIVAGYVSALTATLEAHPNSSVNASVREATHRLRSISTECQRRGLPTDIYTSALSQMGQMAAHVDIDDVLWS